MARDFVINGETLVKVKGGAHAPIIKTLSELGLTSDAVRVSPQFYHRDIKVDDFGPDVPAETMWLLASVNVRMTLIHYDKDVLDDCIGEAMGGSYDLNSVDNYAGVMAGAGGMMGRGKAMFASGNHYVGLNLLSPQLNYPWRFRACYLASSPVELPLGTEKSMVVLNWRSIPYAFPNASGEVTSSGVTLFDHTLDT